MSKNRNRVCPVELAGSLDNRIRRWLQNPQRILAPYVSAGMTVLDIGCGPGFFTLEMARLVGPGGRVIAADLQAGMLEKVRRKIAGSEFESRIRLHKCEPGGLGLDEQADFALAFYVVHEVPDQPGFFRQVADLLRPGGGCLVVEPMFHVTRAELARTLEAARTAGLDVNDGPRMRLSRTALLRMPAP